MTASVAILGPLPAPGAVGGVATHTRELARVLRHRGTRVRVFDDAHVSGGAPDGADGVRGASVSVRARLTLRYPDVAFGDHAALTALGIPRRNASTRSLLLAAANRTFAPDIIHIQQADFRPLYADVARLGRPRVITVHGLGTLQTREYPALASVIPENLLAASAITTPSRALASEVEALGVPAARITVVPNGVDHDVFHPREQVQARALLGLPPQDLLVLFAGRITAHKGAGDLAGAWSRVRDSLPSARLAFVGPAGDADVAGVAGVVTPGPVEPPTLALWLAAADLVVVPSRYEGFGLSALEAMACGRPVVATAVGGLPEVVPPAAGALVPPRDPVALADAITALLGDDDARLQAGTAALAAAAPYTWEAAAEAFLTIYDTLLRC
ncbi:MAG: glycosyltransferase family 4 protein [Coriobacteriia bacterium]